MTDHEFKALNQNLLRDAPQHLTLWKHYKGGLFIVICSSCLEGNPRQVVVTYRSVLYGYILTRTLENWRELVAWDQETQGPRFVPYEAERPVWSPPAASLA